MTAPQAGAGREGEKPWKDWPEGAPIVCSLEHPCPICAPMVERWKAATHA